MAKQDTLPKLPIKGAINGPIAGWTQPDYANYAVVLNADGVVDNIFTSSLAAATTYEVADAAARLALSGTAKKGDMAKQMDTGMGYQLKNNDGSHDSDWVALGVTQVYTDAAGQLFVTASGTDQNVNLEPSGDGYVNVSGYLFVDGVIEGDGANIANLNATNIATGTLADARLAATIARRNAANSFTNNTQSTNTTTGAAIFSGGVGIALNLNVGGVIAGNGSGVINLSTANIATGILGVARGGTGIGSYTINNYVRAANATTLEQRTPAQVRADIGADNASNLISGTVAASLLPSSSLSAQGAIVLASSDEAVAAVVTNKAVVPTGVKAYVDSVTSATASANKIVKANGAGVIDNSFLDLSGALEWSNFPGTVTDTGGDQGDVLSSLIWYYTPNSQGISVDAQVNGVSWFESGGASNTLTAATPSGGSKTWTLPNASGTILLDADVSVTSAANKIVKMNGGGKLDVSIFPSSLVIGNSTSATGPVGTVVAKAQVFNASGISLGFIPIYSSIT